MAEGYKDWSAGDILTAADLEDYTVKQSVMRFADSSARTTALSGVLAEGMVSYLKDTDTVEVYDGSAWVAVGGGDGLVFISRTTIGSAVSSVTVSGAFSTDYDNYRIVVTGGSTSAAKTSLKLTLGATTTGYYYGFIYGTWSGASPALARSSNASGVVMWGGDTNGLSAGIDLYGPFLSGRTSMSVGSVQQNTASDARAGHVVGFLDNATSYTDFDIAITSGTMTGGTIDVYGYAKA